MKTIEEHDIKNFNDLVNVANSENFERLCADFILWLRVAVDMYEAIRAKMPEECKGKSNSEIANVIFRWKDDGKNEITGIEIQKRDNK